MKRYRLARLACDSPQTQLEHAVMIQQDNPVVLDLDEAALWLPHHASLLDLVREKEVV